MKDEKHVEITLRPKTIKEIIVEALDSSSMNINAIYHFIAAVKAGDIMHDAIVQWKLEHKQNAAPNSSGLHKIIERVAVNEPNYLLFRKALVNKERKTIIVDLDGTLSLAHHRFHYLQDRKPPDWDSFTKASIYDPPNQPVVDIIKTLAGKFNIWIWSGRDGSVRNGTTEWLATFGVYYDELRMRKPKDYTPDVQLKRSWLHSLTPEERGSVVAVFDDRNKVVKMWREEGITCCHVAEGDF